MLFTELKSIFIKNKHFWKRKEVTRSIFVSLLFFGVSIIINHYASLYTDKSAGNHVTDILLDNLPVFNVNFMVNEVVWVFIWFVIFLMAIKPQRIAYVLKSLALFIIIRSIFISLTHLGAIPDHSFLNKHDILTNIASGNDMFFSGHTGMPYLLAMIFWDNKNLRYIFIFASFLFGATMILGHLHYSIDVFAALFIAHSISVVARDFFPKDYKLFHRSELEEAKT